MVATKIATRALFAGSLRRSFVLPGLPGAFCNGNSTAEASRHRLTQVRRWQVIRCFADKKGLPGPMWMNDIDRSRPLKQKAWMPEGTPSLITCLLKLFYSNRLRWNRTSRRIKWGNLP